VYAILFIIKGLRLTSSRGFGSVGSMNLQTEATKAFAEIRAAFTCALVDSEVVIDQDPGEYRIWVRFADAPPQPSLWIDRLPKPNLGKNEIVDHPEYPLSLRLAFNATSSSDGQFGWLERSAAESTLSSTTEIIWIIRGLDRNCWSTAAEALKDPTRARRLTPPLP
jgi:hypothetical protein